MSKMSDITDITNISIDEYKSILNYYGIKLPKSQRLIEKKAKQVMANKLCRCIKKIDADYEAKSIGICTKTLFNNRGYTRGKFKCKGNQVVSFKKRKPVKNNKTIRRK